MYFSVWCRKSIGQICNSTLCACWLCSRCYHVCRWHFLLECAGPALWLRCRPLPHPSPGNPTKPYLYDIVLSTILTPASFSPPHYSQQRSLQAEAFSSVTFDLSSSNTLHAQTCFQSFSAKRSLKNNYEANGYLMFPARSLPHIAIP